MAQALHYGNEATKWVSVNGGKNSMTGHARITSVDDPLPLPFLSRAYVDTGMMPSIILG